MKSIWKLLKLLFVLIIILLVIVCAIFICNKSLKKVTSIGPYTSFVITGKSMYPTFNEGDLIIVKKFKSYEIDDIISFNNVEGGITTHRIIDKNGDDYITKGDSNNHVDGYEVMPDEIYGKVIYKIEHLNNLLNFIIEYKFLCIAIIILIPIVFKFLIKVS